MTKYTRAKRQFEKLSIVEFLIVLFNHRPVSQGKQKEQKKKKDPNRSQGATEGNPVLRKDWIRVLHNFFAFISFQLEEI